MDTGATSGAAAKQDIKALENTGLPSTKVFMLPGKSKIRTTHKMLLKHKLWEGAREMNVVPGLLSTHPQNGQCRLLLDIYYTTVWYNLHTYSKSHNQSFSPLFVVGQTGTDRATTFFLSQESNP
jgi:hypothetical protein